MAYLGTLAIPVEHSGHQSLPSSDPSVPKAPKMEAKVIAIQAERLPSLAPRWPSLGRIPSDHRPPSLCQSPHLVETKTRKNSKNS